MPKLVLKLPFYTIIPPQDCPDPPPPGRILENDFQAWKPYNFSPVSPILVTFGQVTGKKSKKIEGNRFLTFSSAFWAPLLSNFLDIRGFRKIKTSKIYSIKLSKILIHRLPSVYWGLKWVRARNLLIVKISKFPKWYKRENSQNCSQFFT